jgi:peroxiredoxin
MNAYRDQYASLFHGGQNVVLLAISNDAAQPAVEWAAESDFPFLFGSDPRHEAYQAFGGKPRADERVDRRAVIVIDPEGRIAEVIPAFNQVDPAAYAQLGAAIDRVTPAAP